jgi:hypothetical protein
LKPKVPRSFVGEVAKRALGTDPWDLEIRSIRHLGYGFWSLRAASGVLPVSAAIAKTLAREARKRDLQNGSATGRLENRELAQMLSYSDLTDSNAFELPIALLHADQVALMM